MKKTIRLAVVDFAHTEGYLVERLLGFVSDRYTFELTEDRPDYILHSCFGYRALRFDGIRVFFSAENFLPDFNISDYAIGMHRLSLDDRYFRLPLYRLYPTYSALFAPREASLLKRSNFCTCVVSNPEREALFEDLFRSLLTYRPILSGGALHNNMGGRVPNKIEFMEKGRFGLAIENSVAPGYITEKITDVFAARAIPIYWGAPDITRDFNPDSFVNLRDYASLEDAVTAIRAIDSDPSRLSIMAESPVFTHGKEPDDLKAERIGDFLSSIFERDRQTAYRRNRMVRSRRYERELKTAIFKPHVQMVHLFRDSLRKLRKSKTFDPSLLRLNTPVTHRRH